MTRAVLFMDFSSYQKDDQQHDHRSKGSIVPLCTVFLHSAIHRASSTYINITVLHTHLEEQGSQEGFEEQHKQVLTWLPQISICGSIHKDVIPRRFSRASLSGVILRIFLEL